MAKTDKICIVCGKGFKGTAKAECCGATCRKKLQRLKEAGKKPEFGLVGGKKSNIKFTKPKESGEKKEKPVFGQETEQTIPVKYVDRMNNNFWNELRKKKLGL